MSLSLTRVMRRAALEAKRASLRSKRTTTNDEKDEKNDDDEEEDDNEDVELSDREVDEEDDDDASDKDASEGGIPKSVLVNSRMGSLLQSGKFSDVIFTVGSKDDKKTFKCHKSILASRSSVFAAMFFHTWKESKQTEIEVTDLSPKTFATMLQMIYTDKCKLDADSVIEVLFAAKKYQVESLRQKCVKFMQADAGVQNACELFETNCGLLEEEEGIFAFIEDHCDEIVKSKGFTRLSKTHLKQILSSDYLRVDESDLFEATVRWAKEECARQSKQATTENIKSILSDCIPLIRFPIMDLTAFAATVPKSGLLETGDSIGLFKLLGDSDKKNNPPKQPWSCMACTYFNDAKADKCAMCGANAPLPTEVPIKHTKEWTCPVCTYINAPTRARCEMCSAEAPKPKAAPKTDKEKDADQKEQQAKQESEMMKKYGLKTAFSMRERTPRKVNPMKMKYLIFAGASYPEVDDVRQSLQKACSQQGFKGKLNIDSLDSLSSSAVTVDKLLEYDCVFTWAGSQTYPSGFSRTLSQYYEKGGSIVCMPFSIISTSTSYCFDNEMMKHLPVTCGTHTATSTTIKKTDIKLNLGKDFKEETTDEEKKQDEENKDEEREDRERDREDKKVSKTEKKTDKASNESEENKELIHPLLAYVKSYDSSTSYRGQIVVGAQGKLIASCADAIPLIVEQKSTITRGKQGFIVVLNVYPVSSNYPSTSLVGWRASTDGHHLLFNALVYAASRCKLKHSKKSKSSSSSSSSSSTSYALPTDDDNGGEDPAAIFD
eukprot:TRINITY_DN4179_c0_g1_i1.p1 TRINITY_DN4179_c0_g1~~TRINITY_DN4179_c0_g1_i1.p1  ORF type:complete len:775 (+),score=229.40 TRINITY_DN4179_c0_g1_i1:61-2385(+)